MTDGDSLNWMLAGSRPALLEGFWNSPARGAHPLGWGVSGMMRDLAQPLVESLFATSTPNDEHYMMDGYSYAAPSLFEPHAHN